jgi:hypothetical protein
MLASPNVAVIALLISSAAAPATVTMDSDNPTCPKAMNWSTYREL